MNQSEKRTHSQIIPIIIKIKLEGLKFELRRRWKHTRRSTLERTRSESDDDAKIAIVNTSKPYLELSIVAQSLLRFTSDWLFLSLFQFWLEVELLDGSRSGFRISGPQIGHLMSSSGLAPVRDICPFQHQSLHYKLYLLREWKV